MMLEQGECAFLARKMLDLTQRSSAKRLSLDPEERRSAGFVSVGAQEMTESQTID